MTTHCNCKRDCYARLGSCIGCEHFDPKGGTMKVVIDGKEFEAIEGRRELSHVGELYFKDGFYRLKPVEKYKWADVDKEGSILIPEEIENEHTVAAVKNLQIILTEIAISAAMNGEVGTNFSMYYSPSEDRMVVYETMAPEVTTFKTREFAEAVLEHYGERLLKAYQAVYNEDK